MHRCIIGAQYAPSQDELIGDICDKTQIFSRCRPRFRVRNPSFKRGREFLDTDCRIKSGSGFLFCHLAAWSSFATVTYAPVSTVTMHGSSPTHPWVTRLGSAFSVMMVNAQWGSLLHMPASTLLRPPSLFSRQLDTLPFHSSDVTWSQFTPLGFAFDSRWLVFPLLVLVIFCLRSLWAVTLDVAWLFTAPAPWLPCVSGERSLPPVCLGAIFVGPGSCEYDL
jgi:hypothetical protein